MKDWKVMKVWKVITVWKVIKVWKVKCSFKMFTLQMFSKINIQKGYTTQC